MSTVLVIVPAHNEAQNLPALLPRLKREAKKINADILAINDASTDSSLNILKNHKIHTLTHSTQLGYGSTIQTGYKYALRSGYDYVIQLDGDGQHDPRCLSGFLKELKKKETDIVIGSRYLPTNGYSFPPQGPLYFGTAVRRIGIRLFRLVLFCLSFRWITDPTSGYIGFNRAALQFVCGKSFPFDYPDADAILTFLKNGLRVKEIPVYMYPVQKDHGLHRGCGPIWYVIKVFISLFIAFIRRREIYQDERS